MSNLWGWSAAKAMRRAVVVLATMLAPVCLSWAAGHDMMQPRVPTEKLAEARALTSPLPDTPDTIAKGKALYQGKGTCVNCHGSEGAGNGPVAAQLNPSPRNFQHHGFWRHRTEGEIFWVIKNGSPGTSMIGFAGQLTDEEIWSIIQYEQTFRRHHGMRGMRGRGPKGHMGTQGDTGKEQAADQPEEEEPEIPPQEQATSPEKE